MKLFNRSFRDKALEQRLALSPLQRIRLFLRWLGVCFSGTKVADALGVPKVVQEAVKKAAGATLGQNQGLDDLVNSYQPDQIVEAFNEPVMNPVIAFQEALAADGDPDKCHEGNPFKGQNLRVEEAWLFEGHVDERGKLLRAKEALKAMPEAWPAEYRVKHVQGHAAYLAETQRAEAALKAQPERAQKAREAAARQAALVQRMKEDGFVGDDFTGAGSTTFDPNQYTEFVPLTGGPFYRQLYVYDRLKQIAYAYEAQNHNPLAKAIIRILVQYAFGRGFDLRIKDKKKERAWQEADQRYNITRNICQFWAKEAQIYGDFWLDVTKWKSVDPSTIWDLITDPDDLDDAYYVYQSYPTAYQMFTGFKVPGAPGVDKQAASAYIVRQIPMKNLLHMKLNCVSNEKFGRSTLFSVLGWLKRVKDLYNAQVIREWLYSCFVWDLKIKGSAADVQNYIASNPFIPKPASPFVHNEAVELNAVPALESASKTGRSGIGEEIISFIAMAEGIPKEFLNVVVQGGGSRAQALTSAEPFTKMIEDDQSRWEWFIKEIFRIVMEQAGLDYEPGDAEVLFPSVTKDTTSETVKNLQAGEAQGWIAKRTAAEMYAKEMNITEYDFEAEQKKIKDDEAKGFSLNGYTPMPGPGRFGKGAPDEDEDGKSDIHGEGKAELVDQLKDL